MYGRRQRRSISRTPLLVALLVVTPLLAVAAFLFLMPGVTSLSPDPDALWISARAPIELVFDRAMRHESVETRLVVEPPIDGTWQWVGNTARFTPLRDWPRDTEITVRLPAGARSSLGLPALTNREWAFVVDPPRVAFIAGDLFRTSQVFAVELDGRQRVQLTDMDDDVFEFDVASDGSFIVYAAAREDGGADLYRLDLATGVPDVLLVCAPFSCRNPVIDPFDHRLAFERQHVLADDLGQLTFERAEVGWLSLDDPQPPGNMLPTADTLHSPLWASADALAVVNQSQNSLALFSLAASSFTMLDQVGPRTAAWRADGQSLIYSEIESPAQLVPTATPTDDPRPISATPSPTPRPTALPEDILSAHLVRYDLATGSQARLTVAPNVEDASPSLSPDGRWLAFSRKFLEDATWTPGRQLWVLPLDGGEPRQLTADPLYAHSSFVWSPDSSIIIYVRFNVADINLPPDILAVPVSGGEPVMLAEAAQWPHWLP